MSLLLDTTKPPVLPETELVVVPNVKSIFSGIVTNVLALRLILPLAILINDPLVKLDTETLVSVIVNDVGDKILPIV